MMNKIKRNAFVALASVAPFAAFAQEAADPFTDALADITASVNTYGPALVGLAAVGVVFMVALKYVKKLRSAA